MMALNGLQKYIELGIKSRVLKVIQVIKAETLIEKLNKHVSDYAEGKAQGFEEVFRDLKLATDMIGVLKSSKHTQKRRRQRLSKKNREKNQKIASLTAELEQLKEDF